MDNSRNLIRKILNVNPNAKTVIMGCYAQLKPMEIAKIKGQHSNKINSLLGYTSKSEVIHKDDMVKV